MNVVNDGQRSFEQRRRGGRLEICREQQRRSFSLVAEIDDTIDPWQRFSKDNE